MNVEVLVCGVFNILHSGHCRLLRFASQFGKVTVGINEDAYLVQKYGWQHMFPLKDRVMVLQSNKYVHSVVSFPEQDPSELIYKVKPKYYIKGPDYSGVKLPEADALQEVGAKLIIHNEEKNTTSGSAILELVKKLP